MVTVYSDLHMRRGSHIYTSSAQLTAENSSVDPSISQVNFHIQIQP